MRASRIVPAALVFLTSSPLVAWAQEAGHGAEGGGGGGLFDINVGLSTWTLLVFGVLVFALGKYAWGPILAAVEAREKGIQDALDEAARRNEEAARLLQDHQRQLADARRQASDIVSEGKAVGERVRKEIEEKARAEGQAILERGKQEIGRERDAALDAMRKASVDLALAAAARLVHENLDEAKDRELVERFLDDMTEGSGAEA
jgi:F-type H+-transporting ATPase subunit b